MHWSRIHWNWPSEWIIQISFQLFLLIMVDNRIGPRLTGYHLTICPGPWFNIKMSSYQYRKSHCGDKTVVRSSYLHNGMTSLYWIRALIIIPMIFVCCCVVSVGCNHTLDVCFTTFIRFFAGIGAIVWLAECQWTTLINMGNYIKNNW